MTPEKFTYTAQVTNLTDDFNDRLTIANHAIDTWHTEVHQRGCQPTRQPRVEFSHDVLTNRHYIHVTGKITPVTDEAIAAAAARAAEQADPGKAPEPSSNGPTGHGKHLGTSERDNAATGLTGPEIDALHNHHNDKPPGSTLTAAIDEWADQEDIPANDTCDRCQAHLGDTGRCWYCDDGNQDQLNTVNQRDSLTP